MREQESLWRLVARPWRSWAGLVALALIVAQAVWRGVLLQRGYFTQDDFLMMRIGADPLTLDMLMQEYAGHLWPGAFVFAWAHAHYAPLDWTVVVVETLAMQGLAAVLLWMVLTRILPASWARVPLFAAGLLCPLTLWPTQWWAAAIGFLPISICLLLALWALLVHLQDGRRWALPLVLGATLAGLVFQERAILFPIALGLLACAYSPASGPRAILESLRSRAVLWVPLAGLLVGYLVLHRALAPITTTSPGTGGDAAELVGNYVVRNAVPGLLGGPWDPEVVAQSLLVPPTYAVVAAWLVVVPAVVWTLRRSRAAAWGWLMLAAYVLVNVGLLFAGRTLLGPTFGLVPRYAADIVPVFPVALALVVRAVRLETAQAAPSGAEPPRRGGRRAALVACGLALAYAASSAVTTANVAPSGYNRLERDYVETLRSELAAQPDAVIFDARVPSDVMVFWFEDDATVSTLVGVAPESPVFDLPSYSMRMVDADGRLRPIGLVGSETARTPEDESCGYPVTARGARVPLERPVTGDRMVARIGYYTSTAGTMTVTGGDRESTVPLRTGLNAVDLVVGGSVDSLELVLHEDDPEAGPGTVCVSSVVVGFPVALTD